MSAAGITLREITRETYGDILGLEVHEAQRSMVATNAKSLAQAHFHPEAWYRGIYAGGEPVGFVMLEEWPDKPEYALWRLMIAGPHQRKGYGRRALDLVVDHVRTRPNATELLTSHVKEDGDAGPFYEKYGFVYTGEVWDGEHIMRLEL